MTATAPARPTVALRMRIARLRRLVEAASAELERLENSYARTTAATYRLGGPYAAPVVEKTPASVVRAWARAAGYPIATRGGIPQPIRDAYVAAHPGARA